MDKEDIERRFEQLERMENNKMGRYKKKNDRDTKERLILMKLGGFIGERAKKELMYGFRYRIIRCDNGLAHLKQVIKPVSKEMIEGYFEQALNEYVKYEREESLEYFALIYVSEQLKKQYIPEEAISQWFFRATDDTLVDAGYLD